MELVLAFAIGWYAGAKGGEEGFREILDAARALRRSEEFAALVLALRSHLAYTLHALGDALSQRDDEVSVQNVVSEVARLVRDSTAT